MPRVPGPDPSRRAAPRPPAGRARRPGDRVRRPWAIILTGGAATRLGGMAKADIRLGDRTLLERSLTAVESCRPVVVGAASDVPVLSTREDPPGGGPAAGVAAGIVALCAGEDGVPDPTAGFGRDVVILAVDQPGITSGTVRRLRAAIPADRSSGACLVSSGHRHYAAAAIPFRVLAAHLDSRPSWHGRSLRSLVGPLIAAAVPAIGDEDRDIDTIDDLRYWADRASGSGSGTAPGGRRDGMDP